ncbi:MAG: hypothetical protein MZV63_24530 [Marinilabiliales bacterium]|nr:hypothetical protein [Marinilabiliales bacterium]
MALPGEVTLITAGLPPGYNRDFQELKAIIFDAFDETDELVTAIGDCCGRTGHKKGYYERSGI